MAEWSGLENRRGRKSSVSSNLTSSAIIYLNKDLLMKSYDEQQLDRLCPQLEIECLKAFIQGYRRNSNKKDLHKYFEMLTTTSKKFGLGEVALDLSDPIAHYIIFEIFINGTLGLLLASFLISDLSLGVAFSVANGEKPVLN